MQENLIEKELKRPLFGRAIRRREGQGGCRWRMGCGVAGWRLKGRDEGRRAAKGKKKALCGNRRPSNDCLPYEKR